MNQPLPYRYIQAGQLCVTRDMRGKHVMEIAHEHCYFIGLRITVGNVMRYQHALILADDYESLVNGINEERNTILNQKVTASLNDIEPVFVRNLIMRDPAMIDSINCYGINTEIQEILSRRDDHRFTVFGKLGDEEICLIPEEAHDALAAMRLARLDSVKLAVKTFQPLDVRQAHPATREFEAIFLQVADRFMKLVGDSYGTGHMH